MQCAAPILAKGYTASNPLYVPCGKCGYCLKSRQMAWSFRLCEEMEQSIYQTYFVTLTYANEHLPFTLDDKPVIKKHFGPELDEVTLFTRDCQLFNKLVRQNNAFHTKAQYRYYLAGEYGSRYGRPHYHLICFNLHPKTVRNLQKYWKHGKIQIEPCRSGKDVSNYVAGYIVNGWTESARINKRPFALMSKKPYLGHTYVKRMAQWHIDNNLPYLERGKHKIPLPQIIKKNIFTQEQLNAFKQPTLVHEQNLFILEMHRLHLLHGHDYDGFDHVIKQRIYHENEYRFKAKHNDKYEYHLGPTRSSNGLPHHSNRETKGTLRKAPPVNAKRRKSSRLVSSYHPRIPAKCQLPTTQKILDIPKRAQLSHT